MSHILLLQRVWAHVQNLSPSHFPIQINELHFPVVAAKPLVWASENIIRIAIHRYSFNYSFHSSAMAFRAKLGFGDCFGRLLFNICYINKFRHKRRRIFSIIQNISLNLSPRDTDIENPPFLSELISIRLTEDIFQYWIVSNICREAKSSWIAVEQDCSLP